MRKPSIAQILESLFVLTQPVPVRFKLRQVLIKGLTQLLDF
jgi:hypothetical protein